MTGGTRAKDGQLEPMRAMSNRPIPPERLAPVRRHFCRFSRKHLWILLEAALCLTCAKLLVHGVLFRILVMTFDVFDGTNCSR